MESTHKKVLGPFMSNEVSNTRLHLVGCLIGESKRQYVPRFQPLLQQIGNRKGKNAGLTRPCTSDNQLWPIGIYHRLALAFV